MPVQRRPHQVPLARSTLPLLAIALLLAGALAAAPATPRPVTPPPLDRATAQAELRYAADAALAVHPALARPAAREAFQRTLAQLQARLGPTPTEGEVAMALQLLLASLGDAHTSSAPRAAATRYLPLSFFATSDAVLVSPVDGSATGLPALGRLESLGGLDADTLLQRMRRVVPGNEAWTRYRAAQMLGSEPLLRWLGAVQQDTVSVRVGTATGSTSVLVPLVAATELAGRGSELQRGIERAAGLNQPWSHRGPTFLWRIDAASNTAVFWLLSCVDGPEYRDAVAAFFDAVAARGIERIVLDLQFDGGGNSNVATPWLQHLPARVIRNYGVALRPSQALTVQRGTGAAELAGQALARLGPLLVMQRQGMPTAVPPAPPLFTGQLVVLTDAGTFSSAAMIATLLSDNGLARVAGEAMGGEPGGYGDILSFRTPALGLPFTVSFKRFARPARSRGDHTPLPLDVPLPLTANDVLTGRDVLAGWLGSLAP